jgi:hypothetical protein
MGERTGIYRVLVGETEEKRPHRRPRHGWEDNINMDLQAVGRAGSGKGQVTGTCECSNEPLGSIYCREFLD